jgi:hypothetical protein
VRRGHRVEDEVQAVAVRLHLGRVLGDHHLGGAQALGVLGLVRRGGEEHHVRAHGRSQLHAHVAEAAEAHDAHLAAGAHLPLAQRRVGGDARAEQRRHGRQLGLGVVMRRTNLSFTTMWFE